MKFTLSWLKTHLDTTASVEDIADALTDLGLEVEGVENPAAKLAGFRLGRVTHAEQHPDAAVPGVELRPGRQRAVRNDS